MNVLRNMLLALLFLGGLVAGCSATISTTRNGVVYSQTFAPTPQVQALIDRVKGGVVPEYLVVIFPEERYRGVCDGLQVRIGERQGMAYIPWPNEGREVHWYPPAIATLQPLGFYERRGQFEKYFRAHGYPRKLSGTWRAEGVFRVRPDPGCVSSAAYEERQVYRRQKRRRW